MYTKRQLLQANRVSQFYKSNESVILIKIIGNTFHFAALSRIEFVFGKEVPWATGVSHIPRCYGNSITMETRVKR